MKQEKNLNTLKNLTSPDVYIQHTNQTVYSNFDESMEQDHFKIMEANLRLAKNRNIQSERKRVVNQTPAKGVYCRYKEFMKMP